MKAIKARWVAAAYDDLRKDHAVLVDNGRIVDVVPHAALADAIQAGKLCAGDVVDRSESILFPGFVNAHMHQYGVLSHGIPQVRGVTDFDSFLRRYWWPCVEDRIRREQVLITARATMAEMLHSGITAFCDILEAPYTEGDTLIAQGEAIERAGMRAIVSLESSQRAGKSNGEACLRQNAEAVDYFKKEGGFVRGAICTHTTFTCPPEMIREAAALAKAHGAFLQFHLSESRYEPDWARAHLGQAPAAIYAQAGALSETTIAAQCVKLDAQEQALLREHGVQTVHLPISNCEVGGGVAPVPELLAQGLTPALGTDGYINDFFQVMREACLIHKAFHETTDVMPASIVFRMATEFGAKAMGLADCGLLKPGYRADLVAYDAARQLTPVTEENLLDQLVIFGSRQNVTDVWIEGRPVLENGALRTLDEERDRRQLRQCAAAFWKEMPAG